MLRELDLTLRPGERVLLVGPSGSGKSTLLRALAGLLLTVDSGDLVGEVRVDGAAPGERPGAVGLVLQEPGSGTVAATVGRDVAFGLENVGVPAGDMPAVVDRCLAAVGLGDLPHTTPTGALSGGQTQRLALAGALALQPALLLLDEPTAMLDADSAARVRDAVVTGAAGLTTVVVEHRIEPWLEHVDRVLVLGRDGRIHHDGSAAEVLAEHGEALAADGIWVPGVPAPEPLTIDLGPLARAVEPGATLLTSEPLVVERARNHLDGSSEVTTALVTDAPLSPAAGRATALVGPSGGGKSTWLAALGGLVTPSSGRVLADGRSVGDLPATEIAHLVGWVPQWSSSALLARTVLDEVLLTGRTLGTADEGEARRLLEVLGLEHLERADPQTLSGGEQRRLAVAAALAHGPAVALADEPTVGQDRGTWAAVVGLLTAHRDRGGAVVAATHDPDLVSLVDEVRQVRPPETEPSRETPRAVLSACGPLALFAAAAIPMAAAVLSPGWRVSLVILGLLVLGAVVGLSNLPGRGAGWTVPGRWRGLGIRLVPALVGGLGVGWSTWLLGSRDVEVALSAALRLLVIVVPSAILLAFVDPDDLADHLGQRLRLPARPVVALGAALQRVQTFGAAWTEVGWARRLRGQGVTWRSPRSVVAHLWASTFGMLLRSLGSAATLAVAMDARGFAGAGRRTWATRAPWRAADTVVVLASLVTVAVALLAR
ncbi:ATP-binding cassette domain-containing protein [Janibacter indicus]|uniref:ATP-binding cassette domain-containing protein n=1 Tax=Janibacter indicus TaxID=857417 RepID=UPI000A3EDD23|nr:ATP-binding cassette domain-containing protein [Janibacter indicus]